MIWPFKRRKPTPQVPPINEDWQAGDLAACISDGKWHIGFGPGAESIHRVTAVTIGANEITGALAWGLRFATWSVFFDAAQFRKVRPDVAPCSAEFSASIAHVRRTPVPTGGDQ